MSVLTKEQLAKAKTVLALGMSAELYANVTREDLLDTIADLQSQLDRAREANENLKKGLEISVQTADAKAAAGIEEAAEACRIRATTEMIMRDIARKGGDLELSKAHGDRAAVLQDQEAVIHALTPADASRALAEQIRKARLEELENLLAITQEPISQAEKVAKVAQRRAELSREP